jgi:hypothetical protein
MSATGQETTVSTSEMPDLAVAHSDFLTSSASFNTLALRYTEKPNFRHLQVFRQALDPAYKAFGEVLDAITEDSWSDEDAFHILSKIVIRDAYARHECLAGKISGAKLPDPMHLELELSDPQEAIAQLSKRQGKDELKPDIYNFFRTKVWDSLNQTRSTVELANAGRHAERGSKQLANVRWAVGAFVVVSGGWLTVDYLRQHER